MSTGILADARHALRLYRATPAASLIAVLVLAVGMAFVTAFVSLYVDLILRPHPGFEGGGSIVTYGWNNGQNAGGLPLDLIARVQEETVSLEAAAGIGANGFSIGLEQEQVYAEMVTTEFFDGLRPRLVRGRGLTQSEHAIDAEPVIVISYEFWQRHFDGRDDVLGQTLAIWSQPGMSPGPDGRPVQSESKRTDFSVIGVMSPRISRSMAAPGNEVAAFWMAVERAVPIVLNENATLAQFSGQLRGIGRRAPGASAEAIKSELDSRFAEELSTRIRLPSIRFDVIDGLVYNVFTQRSTKRQLELFLGASILLALVASANVSLFLLARAPGRRRELAIRMSIGAPLRRLARQLASEAALLVLAGAALGVLLSIWLAEYLQGLEILRAAQWLDVRLLDWRVLALVGSFLLLLSLFVALAPILGLKRLGIAASSRQIAARATLSQRIAGTLQIAVAGTLAGAAIAFTWYLGGLMFGNLEYNTRDLYVAEMSTVIATADGTRPPTPNTLLENSRRRQALLAIPGVTGASIGTAVPGMQNGIYSTSVPHPEDPNRPVQLRLLGIDASYADLLGLNLLHGRAPAEAENGVALVNRKLAQDFWGRDDVVGDLLPFALTEQEGTPIVGVVENVKYAHPDQDVQPMAFLAIDLPITDNIGIIQSTLGRADLERALQGLIDSGTLEVTLTNVESVKSIRNQVLALDRARSFLTIGETVLVVLLAAFGFYGMQRYLVTAGRREYAIRASLGAGPRALGALVFKRGLLLGLPGLGLSLPLAFILVSWLHKEDYLGGELSAASLTGVVTIVALSLVALMAVASIGPMRQARRTQPALLLREE